MSADQPRIALLGFAIECNRFAPVSTREDFAVDVDMRGNALLVEARKPAPELMPDMPGFVTEMDRTGAWIPVPIRIASAQPGGPVDDPYFRELMAEFESGLRGMGPFDGVYVSSHGAALTTASDDPDGELYAMIRRVVGPAVPVIGTFDLHCNVSPAMVENITVFVGYRCNPHTDIRERGVEAARHMRETLAGATPVAEMVKIPLVAPQISLLTAAGPYADAMDYGLSKVGGPVMNVSVMAGFSYSDTPKNGFTAIVTARNGDRAAARALALDIVTRTWNDRARFKRAMTPLDDAVRMAVAVGNDPSLPPIILADVADNPGGGGRGNTTWLLQALKDAGAKGVVVGVFNDPAVAAQAHGLGRGARFRARFNTREQDGFSKAWECDATVAALSDGRYVGRRGLARGMASDMGPSALLDLDGIKIAVITHRQQCLDPMQFEQFGLDPAMARTIVVKSRGHFRAGFDGFVPSARTYEVDCPGLTSPNLATFPWSRLPRPVYPLDEHTSWTPPAA
ncbi:MAG: M81 family metallopeptidase [Rhodospirillales bacterium]|nr:MAG: M81 family metallopeptidase [Rhodospirillales bacterium]